MKKTNKNFLLNVGYQILLYLIPIILTPYLSRVLGPEKIGIYSFSHSIVYYFMLTTLIGINNYGTRRIAKTKDKEELSKRFLSIYRLQILLGISSLIAYNLLILFVIKENIIISIINNLFLLSAIFDINWFYFGLEKFKITVFRNAIIKILSIICVFLLVKTPNDLWIYTIIMGGSTLLSQLYLFLFIKRYIRNVHVTWNDVLSNLKPCLVLFIPVIAYSVYRIMDKTMLGVLSGSVELGYYENAEKIISIPVSLITALGTVMLPHISKIDQRNNKLIQQNIFSSLKLSLLFIAPFIIILALIGDDFASVFFGENFKKCGIIMSLLSISILFTSIANVIRTNYLVPFGKDNIYVSSTIIGALANLICNTVLIPKIGSVGACIGTIIAELVVMLYQILKTRRIIKYSIIIWMLLRAIIFSIPLIILVVALRLSALDITVKVILQIGLGGILYTITNYKYIIYDFFGRDKK